MNEKRDLTRNKINFFDTYRQIFKKSVTRVTHKMAHCSLSVSQKASKQELHRHLQALAADEEHLKVAVINNRNSKNFHRENQITVLNKLNLLHKHCKAAPNVDVNEPTSNT